jgi:hypothetical protein
MMVENPARREEPRKGFRGGKRVGALLDSIPPESHRTFRIPTFLITLITKKEKEEKKRREKIWGGGGIIYQFSGEKVFV